MNRKLLASTLLLAMALPAAAQQPTAAETAFRDAWWAESGQGDLTAALQGYLAAAVADGPTGIRAKALLAAGALQQRLGKTESAVATFKQLLQQFPAEADLVERARTHLRELTAVDLREGYDEWYQRRLFSEEVQLQILQQIQALGSKLAARPRENGEQEAWNTEVQGLCRDIVGYGAGAVPALKKASQSANDALAGRAVELLFQLGELPDAAALQRRFGSWAAFATHWRQLLSLPRDRAASLQKALRPDGMGAALLAASLQGTAALVEAVAATTDPALVQDQPEVIGALTSVLLNDPDSRHVMLAKLCDEAVPLRLREAMELAVCEADPAPQFTASEWLAVGAEPLHYELRMQCIEGAARVLRADDGAVLDEILVRVASAPAGARVDWLTRLCNGLCGNLAPLQVPWTVARLRALVRLFPADTEVNLSPVFRALQRTDSSRALLAEALLGDPVPMREVYSGEPLSLRMHVAFDGDEPEMSLLATRWNRTLAGLLARSFPGFDEPQRLAVLALLEQVMSPSFGERTALLQLLQKFEADGSDAVRAAAAALRQQWGG